MCFKRALFSQYCVFVPIQFETCFSIMMKLHKVDSKQTLASACRVLN